MIRILIERITEKQTSKKENLLLHEEPALDGGGAPIRRNQYGETQEVVMKRDYQQVDVSYSGVVTEILLKQELPEDDFVLGKVISAINNLK